MGKNSNAKSKSTSMAVIPDDDLEALVCYDEDCRAPVVVEESDLGPLMRCTNAACRRKYLTEDQLNDRVCHICHKNMTLNANGMFGPFLSCTGYRDKPSCPGTMSIKYMATTLPVVKTGPPTRVPTDEQDAVIRCAVDEPERNIIVGALAGTGKTTLASMVAYAMGAAGQKSVRALAFTNKNARQLDAAMPDWVETTNWHKLGNRIIKTFYKGAWLNPNKTKILMAPHLPMPKYTGDPWTQDEKDMARSHGYQRVLVEQLVKLVKAYLYVSMEPDDLQPTPLQLDQICANHGVSVPQDMRANVYHITRLVAKEAVCTFKLIDHEDSISIPALWPTIPDEFLRDTVISDESQDLTRAQHILLRKLARVRIFAVGDENQSIYAWRGADIDSMANLAAMFNVTYVHPLTLTYRCGHAIVAEAQKIVPSYRAAPTNPPGRITVIDSLLPSLLIPGKTMILGRVNATLFAKANELIQMDIKVVVAGKDLAQELRNAILSTNTKTVAELIAHLRADAKKQLERSKKEKDKDNSNKDIVALDHVNTIMHLSQGCTTIKQIFARIKELVVDPDKPLPQDVIVCATGHGAKGLESSVVIIADPELLPHPRSKGNARAIRQDTNLRYVMQTRAIDELYYLGQAPAPLDDHTQDGSVLLATYDDDDEAAE